MNYDQQNLYNQQKSFLNLLGNYGMFPRFGTRYTLYTL